MTVFKCKMCAGALNVDDQQSVATCEYCGTRQTLPRFSNERRANLYDRANHFRRNNDFDKAMGIYESILNEDDTDAEAYWSIVLCRYGVEYVEDTASHKRIPTVNRAQFTSIFDDEDYKSAIKNADTSQREIYELEAAAINDIQKEILLISQREAPFDVFICYKETDAQGRRTRDSVLAAELYRELTQEGFKVFFSKITLEDKLGEAYEPYIFAALHSAKAMVVIGTKPEYLNAVWVRNEWSRYLSLIKGGAKKTLIPAYRDMDPYDLPEEFSHLQAQDMSKLGFMQDLIRGIKKILDRDIKPTPTVIKETATANDFMGIDPLLRRAEMALADRESERADSFYEQVLNLDPENAEAYVGKLLIELRIRSRSELKDVGIIFDKSNNYKNAIKFADAELRNELEEALHIVRTRVQEKKLEGIYRSAKNIYENAKDIPTCKRAKKFFLSISDYRDSLGYAELCQIKINNLYTEWEISRKEQSAKIKKRKKANIVGFVTSFTLLILTAITVLLCLFIVKIQIPNAKYDDAMKLVEEERYDEAIALLKEAHYDALLERDVIKFENAIYSAQDARNNKGLVDNAINALKALNAENTTVAVDGKNAVTNILSLGIPVRVEYLCEDGKVVLNTGKTVKDNTATYNKKADFQNFPQGSRTGYTFKLWHFEKAEYLKAEGLVRLVLRAEWTLKNYSVKYKLDADEANKIIKYNIEKEDFSLPKPTKAGCIFLGWTGNNVTVPTVDVTIKKGSYGDLSYVAHWEPKKIKVTFDTAIGEPASVQEYTYGDYIEYLPTPKRDGYAFDGWYKGEEKFDFSRGYWNIETDFTLVARWVPVEYVIVYEILSFNHNEVINPNPTKYNIESDTIVLQDLTHEGAKFLGWYSDDLYFTNKVTEIPKGSTGNIVLYAKWELESTGDSTGDTTENPTDNPTE